MAKDELPVKGFASGSSWVTWLEKEHARSPGLWIKFARKGSGRRSVTHAEALEAALRFGWIDGQVRSLDESWYVQRFTPRAARSKWSRINREKALELIASGRMEPAGLAEVERARADGRWEAAYEPQSAATVPEDLERAFAQSPAARRFFDTLDSRNRYAVLHRIADAKQPGTRARRIEKFVAMLAAGEKLHP